MGVTLDIVYLQNKMQGTEDGEVNNGGSRRTFFTRNTNWVYSKRRQHFNMQKICFDRASFTTDKDDETNIETREHIPTRNTIHKKRACGVFIQVHEWS